MTSTNWSVVLDDNQKAVEEFIDGSSLRSMVSSLSSVEARSEIYQLEREKVPAATVRKRARRALTRYQRATS